MSISAAKSESCSRFSKVALPGMCAGVSNAVMQASRTTLCIVADAFSIHLHRFGCERGRGVVQGRECKRCQVAVGKGQRLCLCYNKDEKGWQADPSLVFCHIVCLEGSDQHTHGAAALLYSHCFQRASTLQN